MLEAKYVAANAILHMACITAHNKPLRRIDFLPVQCALWVTIVDCHRD